MIHVVSSVFYNPFEEDRAWGPQDVSVSAVEDEGSGDFTGWESEDFGG